MTDTKPDVAQPPHLEALNKYNKRATDEFNAIIAYFKQHPTLGISLLYLSFSSFGLIYTNLLFAQFKVNIMLHLEVTDFMLAGFHHPLSMAICIGFVVLLWAANALDVRLKRFQVYYRFSEKLNKTYWNMSPLANYAMLGALAVFAGTDIAAEREADLYLNEQVQAYQLQLTEPYSNEGESSVNFNKVQVISDTVKFLWIRQPGNGKVYAIPQEFVAVLTPIIPEVAPAHEHLPQGQDEKVRTTAPQD